jgi:hypothetical protein
MSTDPNPYGPYILDDGPDSIPAGEIAVFVPRYNTTKPDATGAFIPEAKFFCRRWKKDEADICYVNNKLPKSCHREGNVAEDFLDQMEDVQRNSRSPIAVWAMFMHGYTHGTQFSIRSPGHPHFDSEYQKAYERFISIISEHPAPVVILYACSTGDDPDGDPDTAPGSGDGSFADYVRDDLCKKGSVFCRVFAHTTAGHTTVNPNIKILDGQGFADGGVGGELLAVPGTKEFRRLRVLLEGNLRFRIPFMTISSIRARL